MKSELVRFLRNVGFDCNDKDKDYDFWTECKGQGSDDESCAEHGDCGTCRFEYMKRKGWLSPMIAKE